MSAATMKITSTFPAALASAHSASSASGSTTSCTQRGTTTRGGSGGAAAPLRLQLPLLPLGGAASGVCSLYVHILPSCAKYG